MVANVIDGDRRAQSRTDRKLIVDRALGWQQLRVAQHRGWRRQRLSAGHNTGTARVVC
jgi:hypothetical protein